MTTHQNTLVLVLGATGKTGSRVLHRLEAAGVPTRAGSRTATVPFDWEDTATWAPALDGVSAVYISFFPDLAVPGAQEAVGAFARLAVQTGAKRLVLLSGRGEPEAQLAEQVVMASGADWTILRCSWFSQNFSESFLLDPILGGEVALPVDGVREPFVDVEDIAELAVAALTDDHHVGQLYELTGPQLLSFADAFGEVARAAERPVRFTAIALEDFTAGMAAAGEPEEVIGLVSYLFTEVLDGRNAKLADGVQRGLGREPRAFRDYARRTAATGVWKAA